MCRPLPVLSCNYKTDSFCKCTEMSIVSISGEKSLCVQVSEQHMLPSGLRLFQGWPCIVQQTASIKIVCHCSTRVQVLKSLACSPDVSPTENVWSIMK